jgi:phage shock protein B
VSIVVEGVLVLILAGVGAIIVALAVKWFQGTGSRASHAEDDRTIQEIYQGLSRLEQRVDSLETILTDLKREDRKG